MMMTLMMMPGGRLAYLVKRAEVLVAATEAVGATIRFPMFMFPFGHRLVRTECRGWRLEGRMGEGDSYPQWEHFSQRRNTFGAWIRLWEFCQSLGPRRTAEFVVCCDRMERWIDRREAGIRIFRRNLEQVKSMFERRCQEHGIDPRFCIEVE